MSDMMNRRGIMNLAASIAVAGTLATGETTVAGQSQATGTTITDFGASQDAADNKDGIERAIRAAMAGGRTVVVPPGTFNFSSINLGRNDAVEPVRLVLTGSGTLRSTVRGTSIIAKDGPFYDLVIDGLRFESRASAGTTLIDGDRFIRLLITPGTQIQDFDWVIRGHDHLQSIRMLGAIIRGGHGAVVRSPMAYDCTFAHNIIEFVTDGIVIDGPNDPAANTCRIVDNVIEGLGGRAIVLGACLATSVSGNYLEGNQAGDILLNAGTAPHKGLKVQGNSIQMSAARVAAGQYGIVWGRSTALPVRAGGNFCTGALHDTAGVSALIDMAGDFSQTKLYRGYSPETTAGRTPAGRAAYTDGLSHYVAWNDRYVAIDPYHNEIRFGGKHDSRVGPFSEPPVLTFGPSSPQARADLFERKHWARGSIIFNSQAGAGRPFGWICHEAGQPGSWLPLAS